MELDGSSRSGEDCRMWTFLLGLLAIVGLIAIGTIYAFVDNRKNHRVELEISNEAFEEIQATLRSNKWGSRCSEDGLDVNDLILVRRGRRTGP